MKDIITSLGAHPFIGSIISGIHIATGYVVGYVVEIPPALIQLVQMAAWVGGIGVSVITIIGWLKKNTTFVDHWKFLK